MSADNNGYALELIGFSYAVGRQPILREISFSVCEGDYISVVGPNGAGKSTLLKCVARILTGGSGDVRLFGRDQRTYSQRDLARIVSYVPQADGRELPFTVKDFVLMGRYAHVGTFTSITVEDLEAVQNAMAITGTAQFALRKLSTLSGGERQKAMIAAALAQSARVMLLDEAAAFLDPKHQAEISDILMRANREQGVTILSVTHDINSATVSSNRVIALKEGTVAFDGHPRELVTSANLERIFDARFIYTQHDASDMTFVFPGEGLTPSP